VRKKEAAAELLFVDDELLARRDARILVVVVLGVVLGAVLEAVFLNELGPVAGDARVRVDDHALAHDFRRLGLIEIHLREISQFDLEILVRRRLARLNPRIRVAQIRVGDDRVDERATDRDGDAPLVALLVDAYVQRAELGDVRHGPLAPRFGSLEALLPRLPRLRRRNRDARRVVGLSHGSCPSAPTEAHSPRAVCRSAKR
jgi:hypothetical protein